MSSSIPYNPDDFEDNNPFGEPVIQHQIQDTVSDQNDYQEQVQDDANQEDQSNDYTENEGKLTENELKKLLPERFVNNYLIRINLTSIERNKAGNPILKFDATVAGLSKYRQQKYKDIRRTYNETVKFNKYLAISNLEVFVPVIPSSTTSFVAGGEDENRHLFTVWQEWFDRITNNPILIRDEEFVYFIESDFGYSVINTNRKTSVASGILRKTLKQLAVPYDPYEELADFRPLIKDAYLICQKIRKLMDKNSKAEKQLSIHIFTLSNRLNELSQFEVTHPGMKNMWEKLSKTTQIQSDLVLMDSIFSMGTLGDGIQDLSSDYYQFKEALTNRHLIMRELVQAEQQTKAKHAYATKIKSRSALDPLKVDEAIRSLEYATKAEESLNLQVKRISGEMLYDKKEILDFTDLKFKKLLKNYTLHKVEHHRKTLKHLETIRLDVRIIDEKGGLSRLNRDNLSNLKHNLVQSQSANGDSWSSRTFRSLSNKEKEDEEKASAEEEKESTVIDAKNAASILGVATF